MCYLSCRYNDLAAGYCVVTRQQLGKLNVLVQGLRFQWEGKALTQRHVELLSCFLFPGAGIIPERQNGIPLFGLSAL